MYLTLWGLVDFGGSLRRSATEQNENYCLLPCPISFCHPLVGKRCEEYTHTHTHTHMHACTHTCMLTQKCILIYSTATVQPSPSTSAVFFLAFLCLFSSDSWRNPPLFYSHPKVCLSVELQASTPMVLQL